MTELDIVDSPRLESRGEVTTIGIRETVPFRTMLSNRDRMLAELIDWLADHEAETPGPFFLRLHVVDMQGLMQIEVGVAATHPGDGRIEAGTLPAGDYAVLAYRNRSMEANKLLHSWIREQGIVLDVQSTPEGDRFACRCETYLTDPRTEKRKTRWLVELAFKVKS